MILFETPNSNDRMLLPIQFRSVKIKQRGGSGSQFLQSWSRKINAPAVLALYGTNETDLAGPTLPDCCRFFFISAD